MLFVIWIRTAVGPLFISFSDGYASDSKLNSGLADLAWRICDYILVSLALASLDNKEEEDSEGSQD